MYSPAPALASSRYNRQLLIPSISLSGQHRIAAARILVVGLGGLGSPAALYLAGSGVGKLGLLDDDHVELSNLHRQVIHTEAAVARGLFKVQSAAQTCRGLNSDIEVVPHETSFDVATPANAQKVWDIVSAYDMVLDCTDNPATRYLISDLCVLLGKVLVSGAAQKLEGQVTVLNYPMTSPAQRGPCYRCVFPTPPSPEMVKSCGEIGILGPVVGAIGTLMASEALRLVVKGCEEPRKPTMLIYNAWPADPRSMFRTFGLRGRRDDCISCGDANVVGRKGMAKITAESLLTGSLDYVTFCGRSEPVKVLDESQRVSASAFIDSLTTAGTGEKGQSQKLWQAPLIIDIREPHEIEIGPSLRGSVAVPFTNFLRQENGVGELHDRISKGSYDAVLFICQQGNDSQVAAKKLIDHGEQNLDARNGHAGTGNAMISTRREVFIGDIVGGFAALDRLEN